MQVRSAGAARVSAPRHHLALLDRELIGRGKQVQRKLLLGILLGFYVFGYRLGKALEVGIDGCRPVGMCDVEAVSVSPGTDGDARDVAILDDVDSLPLGPLCLEVDSRVEMIRTQFPEVPAQQDGEVERIRQFLRFGDMLVADILRLVLAVGTERKEQGGNGQFQFHPIHYIIYTRQRYDFLPRETSLGPGKTSFSPRKTFLPREGNLKPSFSFQKLNFCFYKLRLGF